MNLATLNWAKKGLRQTRRRINEKNLSTEERERAVGALVMISYYLLEA